MEAFLIFYLPPNYDFQAGLFASQGPGFRKGLSLRETAFHILDPQKFPSVSG